MDQTLNIESLLNILEKHHKLHKDGLLRLLTCEEDASIYAAADRVRKKYVGDDVHLRGLIEFSNYCNRHCCYCGLRAANKDLKRFRMEAEEIIASAKHAAELGLKTIVLQSGEDKAFSIDDLCNIVYKIKTLNVAVTLSIGELSRKEYAALKSAGADRYYLRIETSNKALYEKLHPRMSFENRVRCLFDLKELGYEVGTGILIGLPGQTDEMLVEDIEFFKIFDADMIGMGPFIPATSTPLEGEKGGNGAKVLRMMALVRLMMPHINMPTTTALSVTEDEGYRKGLYCGGNVIMPNMGMDKYKYLYKIYPGKVEKLKDARSNLETIKSLIYEEGRSVGQDFGNSKKNCKDSLCRDI